MFGINDNDDTKQDDSLATTATDAASSADTSSPPPVDQTDSNTDVADEPAVVQPTGDLSDTTPPPFAVPIDTPPTTTATPPVSPEAILSPTTEQVASTPPTAEATMPENTGMGAVHTEDSIVPTMPPGNDEHHEESKPSAVSLISNGPQADDLLKLKQEALHSLAPLVDQLDQSPEEKFKTTMMLIQASDNADLVHEAYEAANNIPDEKARAQALLDVVNEINYFTQHHEETS